MTKKEHSCQILHFDLYGKRDDKYRFLQESNLDDVEWKELNPNSSFYLFIPQDETLRSKYEEGWSVKDIFDVNNTGVITKRDKLVIDTDKNTLIKRIESFKDNSSSHEDICKKFNLQMKDKDCWDLVKARKEVNKITNLESFLEEITYRPFDNRYIFYHDNLIARRVYDVMKHLLKENKALCIGKKASVIGSEGYDIVFASRNIVDLNLFRRGGEVVFPLYLYETEEEYKQRMNKANGQMGLFAATEEYKPKKENFKPEFREFIDKKWIAAPSARNDRVYTPEEILGYIYAVMHSQTYREKYLEFLKIDFPRIPFTDSQETFEKLSKLGLELMQKHLLEGVSKTNSYTGNGSDVIEKSGNANDPFWANNRLYINKVQYFESVSEEVYNFQIGGYMVLEHYLKDRKGRKLSLDEIENIEKVIKVLGFTINQMQKIDDLTKDWI